MSRRGQLVVYPALHQSLFNCTKSLGIKNAASATALNLLLNATSSQFGTHFCLCKSSQYQ